MEFVGKNNGRTNDRLEEPIERMSTLKQPHCVYVYITDAIQTKDAACQFTLNPKIHHPYTFVQCCSSFTRWRQTKWQNEYKAKKITRQKMKLLQLRNPNNRIK